MPTVISCPECSEKFRVPDSLLGRKVKCPKCGKAVPTAPASEPVLTLAPTPIAPPEKPKKAFDALLMVRQLAEKNQAKWALKQLGKIKPKAIANARTCFARDMEEHEVPLLLVDRSFWQNGKAGLLLTSRRLYGSSPAISIPLEDILTAGFEKPSISELFSGAGPKRSLIVNGVAIYTGPLKFDFWAAVLPQLGNAARVALGKTALAPAPAEVAASPRPGHSLAGQTRERIAAAAICSGKSVEETVGILTQSGTEESPARSMAEEMGRILLGSRARKWALSRIVAGVVAFPVGITGAGLAAVAGNGRLPQWLDDLMLEFVIPTFSLFVFRGLSLGLVAGGLVLLGSGCYRLLLGNPPLKTEELLAQFHAKPR